jgi:hypothetical protein
MEQLFDRGKIREEKRRKRFGESPAEWPEAETGAPHISPRVALAACHGLSSWLTTVSNRCEKGYTVEF